MPIPFVVAVLSAAAGYFGWNARGQFEEIKKSNERAENKLKSDRAFLQDVEEEIAVLETSGEKGNGWLGISDYQARGSEYWEERDIDINCEDQYVTVVKRWDCFSGIWRSPCLQEDGARVYSSSKLDSVKEFLGFSKTKIFFDELPHIAKMVADQHAEICGSPSVIVSSSHSEEGGDGYGGFRGFSGGI